MKIPETCITRRIGINWRCFAVSVLAAVGLLTGCASKPPRSDSTDLSNITQRSNFWYPHLMYLLAAPHNRLYVEVDAVEGCEPGEDNLKLLRQFLASYCQKPGGIEIVRNDVIPIKDAQGLSRRSLARKFLNGPPEHSGSPPAFMYVLFYDGAVADKPMMVASQTAQSHSPERDKNPHVEFLPYPAIIYDNARYGIPTSRDELLIHEAGHLLGLAQRDVGAAGYHCLDEECLMNPTIRVHISRLLTLRDPVRQRQLCAQCAAQLASSLKQAPPANVRFVGPVLVRSEIGYHVLSLPSRVKLIVGSLTDQDCRDYAAAVKVGKPNPEPGDTLQCDVLIKTLEFADTAEVEKIIQRAKADPYDAVRTGASYSEKRLHQSEAATEGAKENLAFAARQGVE